MLHSGALFFGFAFQRIPAFQSVGNEHLLNRSVFAQAMDVRSYLEAFLLEDRFVGIFFVACHVIVGMVAGYHHHGHQGYVLNFFRFQFRNYVFQGRPAFNAVNVDVAFVQAVEAILYYGLVSVGRMGRAMGHYQNGVSLA